jgi:hypothetical protein
MSVHIHRYLHWRFCHIQININRNRLNFLFY